MRSTWDTATCRSVSPSIKAAEKSEEDRRKPTGHYCTTTIDRNLRRRPSDVGSQLPSTGRPCGGRLGRRRGRKGAARIPPEIVTGGIHARPLPFKHAAPEKDLDHRKVPVVWNIEASLTAA
jgi:hypothetical protein